MQIRIVSIPLKEGRRQNDPCNPANCSFVGLVPMKEALKFAPKDECTFGQTPWVNPRLFDPDPIKRKNKMAREIFQSAQNPENFGKFHYLNRGITLVAENATLDNGLFKIDFGSTEKKRGLLDGGTTVSAIVAAVTNGFDPGTIQEGEKEQLVNLRVFCGPRTDDDVVELSEALNKGRQVGGYALANAAHEFDWIKDLLIREKYKVAYATNEDGDIGIDDIIQWASLFVLEKPSIAYSSENACLRKYLDEEDETRSTQARYKNLADVLKDIISLSDHIPAKIKQKYNGNFLALGVIKESSKGKSRLPILGTEIPFTPHKAWLFPILASLRAALDCNKAPYQWRAGVNPFDLFDNVAHKLMKTTNDHFDGKGTMATLGKNSALYELLYSKVETEVERTARK